MKILYFTASYCGPCKVMGPIIDQLSKEYEFIKIEIEKRPDMQQFYGINTVPILIALDNGLIKGRIAGGLNKNQIVNWLKSM